jgi:hypothetical protein
MEPMKKLNMDRLSWVDQAQDGVEADDPWFVHLIAHWDKPERFTMQKWLARVYKQRNLEELLKVTVIFLLNSLQENTDLTNMATPHCYFCI